MFRQNLIPKHPHQLLVYRIGALFFRRVIDGGVWEFWAGPAGCSNTGDIDPTLSIFEAIKQEKIVPCGEAQWRLFGISMAGYSALASLGLSVLAGFFSFTTAKQV